MRDSVAEHFDDQGNAKAREKETKRAARYGEEYRFGQDLPHNGEAGGTESGADGDFLAAGESLGEDKIGDIGAGDEENESDGTEKDEQGGTNVTDELLAQRKDDGAPALVIFG